MNSTFNQFQIQIECKVMETWNVFIHSSIAEVSVIVKQKQVHIWLTALLTEVCL